PLKDMPLASLYIGETPVADLSPLAGMPLAYVSANDSQVFDLGPLADCPGLKTLFVARTKVTAAQVAAFQKALPSCKIQWDDPAKTTTPQPATAAPPRAVAPFDAAQARAHQEAWAKHLGVPLEYTNKIGMKFRLLPPGEYVIGSSDEQLDAVIEKAAPYLSP